MPTKFTQLVGKLQYVAILRRNCLQDLGSEIGISWEYVPVLEHIKKFPGCMQVDISKKLNITPSAVTQSTKKLESAGLIEKKTDPDNLRVKQMYITDKGVQMLMSGTQVFDMVDNFIFDGFSDEETDCLSRLLDKINGNISAHISGDGDKIKIPWEFK